MKTFAFIFARAGSKGVPGKNIKEICGKPLIAYSIEIAHEIIKLTSSKSKIVHKELPEDDPTQRQPDISLAKKKLGWTPKIELELGLKKTIEYFK